MSLRHPLFAAAIALSAGFVLSTPLPAAVTDEDATGTAATETAATETDASATDSAANDSTATDPSATPSATPDPLAEGPVSGARGGFAAATRTFFSDGAYLFSFPARTTPRGVGLTAAWGGATLLALHNDDWIFHEVASQNEEDRDHAAQVIEPLGRMPVQAGVLGILYASGKMADNESLASTAGTAFEALLWSGLISNTGKMIFGREQPSSTMDARYFFEGQGSFPSGHAARSFAIAAVIADRYGAKGAWWGYGIAGAVSLSMVQREIHWASDVVAGAGLGLAIGKGVAKRHPGPAAEAGLGASAQRRFAWQLHPARDGAALTLVF